MGQTKTWEQYIRENYMYLMKGGHWISKQDGRHVFVKEDPIRKFEKTMKSMKQEETSEPVPEKEWVKELQLALNKWRDFVFREGSEGRLKDRSTQKID